MITNTTAGIDLDKQRTERADPVDQIRDIIDEGGRDILSRIAELLLSPQELSRRSTTANDVFNPCTSNGVEFKKDGDLNIKASDSDGTAAAGAARTERDGWEAAAKALAGRAAGHDRMGNFTEADECRTCVSMLHDMKPATGTAAATSGSELPPDERAKFENWVKSKEPRTNLQQHPDLVGEYFDMFTQVRWVVWQARAAVAQQAVAPAGYKLVPIEPTPEMLKAATAMHGCTAFMYEAMLAAAPSPSAEEDQDAMDAARWSKVPPTEQGEYWNWDGDEDHAPMIYHVLWSGTAKKCFVSMGQYGIDEAIWCDKFGGWWLPIEQPSTRDAAMSQAKGAGKEGAA